MSLRDDKLFVLWEASLKSRTAATYRYGLMKQCDTVYKTVCKTPTQIIEEAGEDYLSRTGQNQNP